MNSTLSIEITFIYLEQWIIDWIW